MITNGTFYRNEITADYKAILALHQKRLGPGRYAKSSYRVREIANYDIALSHVALQNDCLIGSVRQTWVKWSNGELWAYLGPLVVDEKCAGQGVGQILLEKAAFSAQQYGARGIILVGDSSYYKRAGYQPCSQLGMKPIFPGPTAPNRALVLILPYACDNRKDHHDCDISLPLNAESYRDFTPFQK